MLEAFLTGMGWGFGLLIPLLVGGIILIPTAFIFLAALLKTLGDAEEEEEDE